MKENEALNKVINDALIKVGVSHPYLEAAKENLKELFNNKKDDDILSAITEWAKTKDIGNYILAPNNNGGGSQGGATHWQHTDRENPADWDLWAFIPHCEVWQAVALSLDIEPPKYSHEVKGWPPEYERRLKITSANIEYKNLPRSKTSINNVDLIAFSTWALSLGWNLPDKFPRGVVVKASAPIEITQSDIASGAIKESINITEMWLAEAQNQGKIYMEAWRKAGYDPTIANIGLYVEGYFSDNQIYNSRKEVIDRATIVREALTGITGRNKGYKSKLPKIPDGKAGQLPQK